MVFITAWDALAERARVGQGKSALIHGGAGGTGQIAIQVPRELGARIATTVSSDDKAELLQSLGAPAAFRFYSTPAFPVKPYPSPSRLLYSCWGQSRQPRPDTAMSI